MPAHFLDRLADKKPPLVGTHGDEGDPGAFMDRSVLEGDPHQVLERGYAWLADEQGRALTRAGQFQTGQSVRAVLADGELDLQVQARRLHG